MAKKNASARFASLKTLVFRSGLWTLVLAAAVLGMTLGIRADGTADVHTARGMLGIVSIFVSFPALI